MKNLLILAILFLPVTLLYSLEVNVIMNDGSVVKGNMLGKTANELFLDGENGKARSIALADVKAVFNAATGNPVDNAGQPAQTVIKVIPGYDYYYYYNGLPYYYYNYLPAYYYEPGPVFYTGPRWYYHYGWGGWRRR
jgi:hypothetical protein